MNDKKIYLYDYIEGGHHETYILIYAKILLELGNEITIFYPHKDIFLPLQEKYGQKIKINTIKIRIITFKNKYLNFILSPFSTLKLLIDTHLIINKEIKKELKYKPDLVFFLWVDSFISNILKGWLVDLILNFKWAGIYFHPTHLRTNFRKILPTPNNNLFKSKSCQFVIVLDEGIADNFSKMIAKKVYTLPDVTNESLEENLKTKEKILKKSNGRKIITMLGSFSKRKGLLTFIECIKKLNPNKYYFIIGGEFSQSDFTDTEFNIMNIFFNSNQENIFSNLKRINDGKEFNTLVRCSDILIATYKNFYHSSNILTKAALFNKFVIVSDKNLMAERVKKFKTGICVEQENIFELSKAIENLSKGIDLYNKKLEPGFEKYFLEHSQKKLSEKLSEIYI